MRDNANFFLNFKFLPRRIMNIISSHLSNIQNILFAPFFEKSELGDQQGKPDLVAGTITFPGKGLDSLMWECPTCLSFTGD